MKQILLHGILKKLACPKFNIKASCFQDVLNCLSANFPKLRKHVKRFKNDISGFILVVDDKLIDNLNNVDKSILTGKTIEIIPVVMLSALISATFIAGLIGASSATAASVVAITFVANVLVMSIISFGISFLVAKLLTPKDPKQVKTSSFIFSSKENSVARNTPIPIGYGRLRVGSCLISSIEMNFDIDLVNNTSGGASNSLVGGPVSTFTGNTKLN